MRLCTEILYSCFAFGLPLTGKRKREYIVHACNNKYKIVFISKGEHSWKYRIDIDIDIEFEIVKKERECVCVCTRRIHSFLSVWC